MNNKTIWIVAGVAVVVIIIIILISGSKSKAAPVMYNQQPKATSWLDFGIAFINDATKIATKGGNPNTGGYTAPDGSPLLDPSRPYDPATNPSVSPLSNYNV